MVINGKEYPVIGKVKSEFLCGLEVPILDIPMMSDERWMELVNSPEQIERRRKRSLQKAGEQNG